MKKFSEQLHQDGLFSFAVSLWIFVWQGLVVGRSFPEAQQIPLFSPSYSNIYPQDPLVLFQKNFDSLFFEYLRAVLKHFSPFEPIYIVHLIALNAIFCFTMIRLTRFLVPSRHKSPYIAGLLSFSAMPMLHGVPFYWANQFFYLSNNTVAAILVALAIWYWLKKRPLLFALIVVFCFYVHAVAAVHLIGAIVISELIVEGRRHGLREVVRSNILSWSFIIIAIVPWLARYIASRSGIVQRTDSWESMRAFNWRDSFPAEWQIETYLHFGAFLAFVSLVLFWMKENNSYQDDLVSQKILTLAEVAVVFSFVGVLLVEIFHSEFLALLMPTRALRIFIFCVIPFIAAWFDDQLTRKNIFIQLFAGALLVFFLFPRNTLVWNNFGLIVSLFVVIWTLIQIFFYKKLTQKKDLFLIWTGCLIFLFWIWQGQEFQFINR
ncbi:MAG: hypothetical protein ACK5WZ_04080, partial [Pseudobdellovibrionaceae bacterium]